MKHQINQATSVMKDNESKIFMYKNQMDRYRSENDQIKVDLTYAKATAEN